MKKVLLCMTAMVFSASLALAQSEKFATEILFNPFANNPFSLINGVRGYYALNDKASIRCDFGFGYNSSTGHVFDNDGKESTGQNRVINFSFYPGIQYSLAKVEKLSIYVGGALGFGISSAKAKIEADGFNAEISGAIMDDNGDPDYNNRSSRSFGLQAFTGVDYSLYKNLYIGAELGLSFNTSWQPEIEMTTGNDVLKDKDYTSSSSLGFFIVPAFRLGWRF